ncbi:Cna protein B-type domain-containing protein [Peptostreptococcaceae bacterium pGA-8]|nr:Cna protein B-type domain-containing protein [Peptostreptococcaceae bacterium pGA-8]
MPSKSEEEQATTTVEQYLKSNVNSQYANVKSFKIAGSMTIAPTMATADTTSLDDLWAEQNIDKFKSAGYSTVALYDVDKDSAYYVAYVQSDITDAKLVQALAAKNNTNAELRKDVIYENGIAYVPKKYDPNNDTRMQLLYATSDNSEAKTEVTVKNNNVEGDFIENLIVTSKLDSNFVKFNITKGNTELDYYDIKSLKINGKEEVNNLSFWAINDSTIIINGVPASINKVEIELAKETILIKAGAPAWYTSPVMTLPGTWEFGHEPRVNEVIKIFNTHNTYYGNSQGGRTGYTYGASTHWMNAGTVHTAIAHVALGWKDAPLDDLDRFTIASLRTTTIPAQTVGDIKIPSIPEFSMVCSHIGVNANLDYQSGYNNGAKSDPGLRVRIIAKYGNKLLCAFVSPTAMTQAGAGLFMIQYQSGGKAYVQKTSANPDAEALTKLCPLYTLAGAKYTFYKDKECKTSIVTVTTDKAGKSNTIKVASGTYYVKETKAPFGYLLDKKVHEVTVKSGQTVKVAVKDRPMLDPIRAVVQKTVEEGADKNLSVKGAEFEFKYYPTLGDITKSEAIRTWNFAADDNGFVRYDDRNKISGDELFKYKDAPIGIIGTYTIKETKAPKGLALDERTIYVRIAPNAKGTRTIRTFSESATFTNPVEIKDGEALFDHIEKTQKVNLHLQKVDAETKQSVPQGYGTLEGAIYSVFRFDPLAAEDEFVADIVTDAAGKAV